MTQAIFVFFSAAAAIALALGAWRWSDIRTDRAAWRFLRSRQSSRVGTFHESMAATLPDPARRFFRFAIAPGTPLRTVAEIAMEGELGLGNRDNPRYMPMRAGQILAAPHGFVWRVQTSERVRFTGSDGAVDESSWSRFWLLGLVPVARAGGNADHLRSAFGRLVAEAVFWTPAALLPGDVARWEAIDDATARVFVTRGKLSQAVDLTVDADGRPTQVVFQRWSNANPAKTFREQPFGGCLSDYKVFDGYRLPTRIEAGNHFGTDDYFPFFKIAVTDVRFPLPGDETAARA